MLEKLLNREVNIQFINNSRSLNSPGLKFHPLSRPFVFFFSDENSFTVSSPPLSIIYFGFSFLYIIKSSTIPDSSSFSIWFFVSIHYIYKPPPHYPETLKFLPVFFIVILLLKTYSYTPLSFMFRKNRRTGRGEIIRQRMGWSRHTGVSVLNIEELWFFTWEGKRVKVWTVRH